KFRREGNTSVAPSPASDCRAGTTRRTESLDCRASFLTEVNGRKNSRHWLVSFSPCQSLLDTVISRAFKVEREGKNEFKTCARAERCQSDGLQVISKCRAFPAS